MAFSFNAPTTAPPPQPTTGGLFSNKNNANATNSTTGFNFGGNNNATTTLALPPTTANTTASAITVPSDLLVVPNFENIFPGIKIYSEIRDLLTKAGQSLSSFESAWASEELTSRLSASNAGGLLSTPKVPQFVSPNNATREKLQKNPTVNLYGKEAALTPEIMREIVTLQADLRLSEENAMALYAKASESSTRLWLEETLDFSFVDESLEIKPQLSRLSFGTDVVRAAREIYFFERQALLKTVLCIAKLRIQGNPHIITPTDQLFEQNIFSNLVAYLLETTKVATEIENQLTQKSQVESENHRFGKVWLRYLQCERQRASQCLYYFAYHTQCLPTEVAALIDSIRDLTNGVSASENGLPILDPFNDVPDAYHQGEDQPMWGFSQPLPPRQEKNPRDWEKELVKMTWGKGSKPQLLECVSVLLMACVSALDTKNTLIDRKLHGPNQFGPGNAIFPPPGAEVAGGDVSILPINERLSAKDSGGSGWNRQDVWGILASAYAMMLQPLPNVLGSPRSTVASPGSPRTGRFDIKSTWKTSLIAPSLKKSFSFIRISMIPVFRCHQEDAAWPFCNTSEFLMSSLAEFISCYLDMLCVSNMVPASRKKWEETETESLQMRREEQERERTFYANYGSSYENKETIPKKVDLSTRPDCIDDLIAAATAVCSSGSEFAAYFWTKEGQAGLFPSRTLTKLEMLQEKDKSLIPTYISFLAGLAMACPVAQVSGAKAVFNHLQPKAEDSGKLSWKSLLTSLRWYVRSLNPSYTGTTKRSGNYMAGTPGRASTCYYYGIEDNGFAGTSGYATSASGSDTRTSTKLKELDDVNTAIMLSHLAVISKVATFYPSGRAALADLKVPLEDGSAHEDSILLILFSLSITPLTPKVRGAVFSTIACLLLCDGVNRNEEKTIRTLGRRAWDLLEMSQVVPVRLLAHYSDSQQQFNSPTMMFPGSTPSKTNTAQTNTILPPDQKYNILYEMEHVESHAGVYPSTEGLLQLLSSLVCASGCPHDLGRIVPQVQSGRLREGCTPYVEYAMYFVLKRALGSRESKSRLPFRSYVDSARLISRALQFVESIIARYYVPSTVPDGPEKPSFADALKDYKKMFCKLSDTFRLPSLVGNEMLEGLEIDIMTSVGDFTKETDNSHHVAGGSATSLPRVMSPGFTVLAEMLSSESGVMFKHIAQILTNHGGSNGVWKVYAKRDRKFFLTQSLFGDSPPTLSSAKQKGHGTRPSFSKFSFSSYLMPEIDISCDHNHERNSIGWRERAIELSLRILLAATVREAEFCAATKRMVSFVPTMHVQKLGTIVQRRDSQLALLREIFTSGSEATSALMRSLVEYTGHNSVADHEDSALQGTALALVVYVSMSSDPRGSLLSLCGGSRIGEALLARSVARCLKKSCSRTYGSLDKEIIDLILHALKQQPLSAVLFGLPRVAVDGTRDNGSRPAFDCDRPNECLSVLLDLTLNDGFITDPNTAMYACRCFELIYFIYCGEGDFERHRDYVTQRLEMVHFWSRSCMRFFAYHERNVPSILARVCATSPQNRESGIEYILHAGAWVARGVALHLTRQRRANQLSRNGVAEKLLGGDYFLLRNIIECIPIGSEENTESFPRILLPHYGVLQPFFEQHNNQHDKGNAKVDLEELESELGPNKCRVFAEWAEKKNSHIRWDGAAAHLTRSVCTMAECALDFLEWKHTLGQGTVREMSSHDDLHAALLLLDILIERLTEERVRNTLASPHQSSMSCLHLSTEVLLLVNRLANDSVGKVEVMKFLPALVTATRISLERKDRDRNEDTDTTSLEQSLILASAMAKLVSMSEDIVVLASIESDLLAIGARLVEIGIASGKSSAHQAHTVHAARRLIFCIVRALPGERGENRLVSFLGQTRTSFSQESILQSLVFMVAKQDEGATLLLETLAAHGGGLQLIRANLLEAMKASAGEFTTHFSDRSLTRSPPPFIRNYIRLLRAVLSTIQPTSPQEMSFCRGARMILCRFGAFFENMSDQFPLHGDLWLDFVECLAVASSLVGNEDKENFSTISNGGDSGVLAHTMEIKSTCKLICTMAMHLLQFPFPSRLLPLIPVKLMKKGAASWWETIEGREKGPMSENTCLRNPPTGLTFSGYWQASSSTDDVTGHWTARKYDIAFASIKLVDAALHFLLLENFQRLKDFRALVAGICRQCDITRAMARRLKEIDAQEHQDGMDLGIGENRFNGTTQIEKQYLNAFLPFTSTSCEKALALLEKQIASNRATSPENKEFISLMLQHTRINVMGLFLDESGDDNPTDVTMLRRGKSLEGFVASE